MSGLIRSMRPRQWLKNGVVLAALVFAQQGDRLSSLLRALAALGLFSLLASAVYLFNDLLDRERLGDAAERSGQVATQVVQHVFKHHGDEALVLDHQNAQACHDGDIRGDSGVSRTSPSALAVRDLAAWASISPP